jgi:diguanylate cyclase (GGDEF)-like protein
MVGMQGDARESGQHLSLMVVDIDHFNELNETMGYKTGDLVLQQVAKVLEAACRKDDLVARVGGEEFAIALPGIGLADAAECGEAIRAKIMQLSPCGISVTASIGIAEMIKGEVYDELYRRAGSAMYCAKLGGRNRVMVAAQSAGREEHNSFYLRRVRRESRDSVPMSNASPVGNSLPPDPAPTNN